MTDDEVDSCVELLGDPAVVGVLPAELAVQTTVAAENMPAAMSLTDFAVRTVASEIGFPVGRSVQSEVTDWDRFVAEVNAPTP